MDQITNNEYITDEVNNEAPVCDDTVTEEAVTETAEEESEITEDTVETADESKSKEKSSDEKYEREPYYKRHYLLYGKEEIPESIDIKATRDFLIEKGFGNGSLKQARDGKRLAGIFARNYKPNKPGSIYCSFCGIELVGTEFDILHDGRIRCPACTRSSLKEFEDYKVIYADITRNLQTYFGVRISSAIDIEVLNTKKLHAKMGKTFVPSLKPTPRTLGFACKDKKGNFSLCLENGSPRVAAIMTMVHELTHIWQYENWKDDSIKNMYGAKQQIEIYEGMARWVEIQYAFLIGENAAALRQALGTLNVDDEYGRGFKKYIQVYPISEGTRLEGLTPFNNKNKPL